MTDEKIISIYEQSQHIRKCADVFQACIHVAGCYGFKNEWVKLRSLYFGCHTPATLWHFSYIYSHVDEKILQAFGFRAWLHTPTLDFGED